jgi:hypothetical protein
MNPNELSAATFPKTNLTILQDKSSFCFGIDAVLLADFTRRQIPQEKIKMKQKTLPDMKYYAVSKMLFRRQAIF